MTLKDLILGLVGLAALVLWTCAYGSWFVVRETFARMRSGEWRKY